ncbi:uncharacterized protein A4U43_C05F29820 [Asparagus officinalis]|uniref:Uncharacterized protein n=1 Tax=Asparagus officinalis TaxID=4686 RepID=A0A5P1EZS3_ASPOF|nr:uncharacterized protein A4U43_C05F29820 [Asparagus officinalis]
MEHVSQDEYLFVSGGKTGRKKKKKAKSVETYSRSWPMRPPSLPATTRSPPSPPSRSRPPSASSSPTSSPSTPSPRAPRPSLSSPASEPLGRALGPVVCSGVVWDSRNHSVSVASSSGSSDPSSTGPVMRELNYMGFSRFINVNNNNGATPLHLAARQR